MDIISSVNSGVYTVVPNYSEVIPYKPSENNISSNLAVLLRRNAVNKNDALRAVKLDPAVLEAQLSVDGPNAKAETNELFEPKESIDPIDNQTLFTKPTGSSISSNTSRFEDMVSVQQAALLSLTPDQLDLLMKYVDTLRRQRQANQVNLECAFCKNNGESVAWYSSHSLRNWRGRVQCPVLRAYRCRRCGATGDRAHTIKYCPENIFTDSWCRTSSP